MSIKSRLYYKIVYNINKINDGLCNNIYDRRILNRLKICLQWEFKHKSEKTCSVSEQQANADKRYRNGKNIMTLEGF